MRRLALLVSLALTVPGAALAQAAALAVTIDQSERVTVSRPMKEVVVGNPGMVEVSVLDEHHLLLTGRAYGVTNLVVSDAAGRPIMARQLVVQAPDQGRVSVWRGSEVSNYACVGKCELSKPVAATPVAP